ncbi:MAG: sigma-70 family RNA polymerase sigma factor [Clostridiales bacterium]|nr:sigma-70 family RNA polymerase sigma factor [Clostridiales bacterium]
MRDEFVRELYEQYFDVIKKYCLPKLGFDEDAAADCAHAVLDRAEEQYEKLKSHPAILGWLLTTAKHLVHKNWKRSARETIRNVPLDLLTALPDSTDPFDAVELSEAEIRSITEAVLSGLDEREREFYRLCFRENRSFTEIAEMTGVSEKAARAKLARIKLKLKQRIIYFLNE